MPEEEIVTDDEGNKHLVPGRSSLRERLTAKEGELVEAHKAIKQRNKEILERKRQAKAESPSVPAEKTIL